MSYFLPSDCLESSFLATGFLASSFLASACQPGSLSQAVLMASDSRNAFQGLFSSIGFSRIKFSSNSLSAFFSFPLQKISTLLQFSNLSLDVRPLKHLFVNKQGLWLKHCECPSKGLEWFSTLVASRFTFDFDCSFKSPPLEMRSLHYNSKEKHKVDCSVRLTLTVHVFMWEATTRKMPSLLASLLAMYIYLYMLHRCTSLYSISDVHCTVIHCVNDTVPCIDVQ